MTQPFRALLLSAGLGTRLRPITLHTPKCLVPIGGEALLGRWLRKLEMAGCDSVLVNTHYLAEQVEAFLKSWQSSTMTVQTVHEPELLGTAGTLITNQEFLKGATGLQAPTTIKKARRYKVWIPIINDPGKNNLLISPYSHEEIRKHQANKDENGDLLSSYVDKYELKMVENKSFQPLIFSMNLLHGGSLNTYDELRISLEFEILIQDGK